MKQLDIRVIALVTLVVIALFTKSWTLTALISLAIGGWLVSVGWQRFAGRLNLPGGGGKVTYWRGQRVVIKDQRSRGSLPSWQVLVPGIFYLLLGAAIIAQVVLLITRIGL